MIGDWVQFADGNKQCVIVGIMCDARYLEKEATLVLMDKSGHWFEKQLDDIKPVPLTTEILEKNGFAKDEEIDQWYFKSNDRLDLGLLAVGIDDGCGTGFCVMRNGAVTYFCRYVHELQHYLRLIGGAKEIEL